MAKAPDKPEEAATEAAPPKANKKRLIIIIGAVVLLLVLSATGAYFWKKGQKAESDDPKVEHTKKEKGKAEAPPVIVKLDQFTVKLQSDENKPEQYMQTVIELEVIDNQAAEKVKVLTSKIRSKVLLLLMGKTPSELSSPQGVETLSAEIRNQINQIVDGGSHPPGTIKAGPDDSVQAVYLTQFIIQ